MITGDKPHTFDEVWQEVLRQIMSHGMERSPRRRKTKELLALQLGVSMKQPLLAVRSRALGYRFACAEAAWILGGDNRLSAILPYAKMMAEFSDDGMVLAGAYGPPLRDQLPHAVHALVGDPQTRQAVVTLWRQRPGPSRDVPCTVALQWLIRDNELNCVATMRSSDAWLGLPYDVFAFSCISAYVHSCLETSASRVKHGLGNLYLTLASSHLYEQHWEMARTAINDPTKIFTGSTLLSPVDWKGSPTKA